MWRVLVLMLMTGCVRAATPDQVTEAKAMVARGGLLLDVRTPEEFAAGHVEGALNLPVQDLDAKWASLNVPADREVVVYCRSGRRSATAKGILEAKGVKKVVDLGAMSNWK